MFHNDDLPTENDASLRIRRKRSRKNGKSSSGNPTLGNPKHQVLKFQDSASLALYRDYKRKPKPTAFGEHVD